MSGFNNIDSDELLKRKKEEKLKKEKQEKIKKKCLKALKYIGVVTGTLIIIATLLISMFLSKYGQDIVGLFIDGKQKVENVTKETFNTRQPTRVYDKNGKVIYEFKESNYIYTDIEDLNPAVMDAFIAIEDSRFMKHQGIDYIGTLRALIKTLSGVDVQGGSSITQQLAKNVFLTHEQTIARKIKEAVIASNLERKFTKKEIFEFYVNNIYYGYGCYSFESASQYYFQKNNNDLSVGQVATLAGVINNPTQFDPIRNPENAINKRNRILGKMREEGFITKEVYETEKAKGLELNPGKRDLDNTIKSDTVSYAIDSATEIMMEKNGFQFQYNFKNTDERKEYWSYYNEEYKATRDEILTGGYEIHTVIDPSLDKRLSEMAQNYMKGFTATNEKGVYKKQVSLTAIDNKTGKVVSMVGGRGQSNDHLNRAFQSPRQPGSAIKPLVAYAPAFERGQVPSSIMVDAPIENGPRNSTGDFSGPVTLRYALEKSINTIPYRIVSSMGADVALSYLEKMQFQTLTHTDNNPIISVGGFTKGVTTEEMASGFSTLARNGEFLKPSNITKIVKTNTQDIVYEDNEDQEPIRVYDDGASYLVTDSLKGVLTEGTGTSFKPKYPHVAGKTGTTNMQKDRWMVGYNPYYTVAVWVGDDKPTAQSGIMQQGYIWRDAIDILSEGKKVIDFEKPSSVSIYKGELVNDIYLNKKDTSDVKRKNAERDRINKENELREERIANEDYRLLYGLTREEETRREQEAEKALSVLENYNLVSESQFEELNELLENARSKIDLVKHKKAYDRYMERYSDLQRQFNSIKYDILNPPQPEIPEEEVTEEVVPPETDNSENGETQYPSDGDMTTDGNENNNGNTESGGVNGSENQEGSTTQ